MTLLTEFLSVKSWRIKKEETSQDIGFTRNNQWFRYRAAGIIIKDDAVLMVGNDHNDYYYSVGGAVQLGETAEEACLRELYEETGLPLAKFSRGFCHLVQRSGLVGRGQRAGNDRDQKDHHRGEEKDGGGGGPHFRQV